MEFYALNNRFNLVSIGLAYDNVQWNRRYYEAGSFQMQLPVKLYDPSWAYIGTTERPELGMVQKVEYSGEGDVNVLISGYFCEKMLDDKVIFPKVEINDTNIEHAVRDLFVNNKKDLPIGLSRPNSPILGENVSIDANGDFIGTKIYSILESQELTYSVTFDYDRNDLWMRVWQGKDRTQSQDVNPYQVFSTEFGNITDKKVSLDDSGYRNYAIIPVMDEEYVDHKVYYLDWSHGGYRKEIVLDHSSDMPDEYTTDAQFKEQILQQAAEEMAQYAKVEDIDITVSGTVGYMTDFDIGDKCDVELTDIGVSMETRIVQVDEVFKAPDGHSVTVGLGNKRINNIRRAVKR